MMADAFDLLQGVGGEVALAAVRTRHDRHVLDQERMLAATDLPGDSAQARCIVTADVTDHGRLARSSPRTRCSAQRCIAEPGSSWCVDGFRVCTASLRAAVRPE